MILWLLLLLFILLNKQFKLLYSIWIAPHKIAAEILSEHARGTSVFHEVLNWQNNNTSSLLQILSRWNHKCTVLFWAPMVQSKRVEYYDHFLRNNVHIVNIYFCREESNLKRAQRRRFQSLSDFFSSALFYPLKIRTSCHCALCLVVSSKAEPTFHL